jgi:hypothetical protein
MVMLTAEYYIEISTKNNNNPNELLPLSQNNLLSLYRYKYGVYL